MDFNRAIACLSFNSFYTPIPATVMGAYYVQGTQAILTIFYT